MKKKLIEVALPLEAINKASSREKSIRHGHPSTLHLWWARRPLAAARAVIFSQMVDDPSAYPDLFPTEKKQEKERQRFFKIIEDLVLWENTTKEEILQRAREEIWPSRRVTLMLILAGRWLGLSSTVLAKDSSVSRRHFQRQRTQVFPVW